MKKQLLVRDLLAGEIPALLPKDSVRSALELMIERGIHYVAVVTDDLELLGIVSSHAITNLSYAGLSDASPQTIKLDQVSVNVLMEEPARTVTDTLEAETAAESLLDQEFGCLPVLSGGRFAGILTAADFVGMGPLPHWSL